MIGIGDDDAFNWVGIVRRTAQDSSPRFESHDAAEIVSRTDDADPIADNHTLATEFACLHCPDRSVRRIQEHGETPAIHGKNESWDR